VSVQLLPGSAVPVISIQADNHTLVPAGGTSPSAHVRSSGFDMSHLNGKASYNRVALTIASPNESSPRWIRAVVLRPPPDGSPPKSGTMYARRQWC
jgi:hypothetical protein